MKYLNIFNPMRIFQHFISLLLGISLITSVLLSYDSVALAATSAASSADAARINQRKEEAPRYPNWYSEQRSLESYMDDAGVDPKTSNTRTSNTRTFSSVDRDDSDLIERSQDKLKNIAGNIRDSVRGDADEVPGNSRDRMRLNAIDKEESPDAQDIPARAENRLEKAKDTFQSATKEAARGRSAFITGETNTSDSRQSNK